MTVLRKMPTRFVAIDNAVARDDQLSFRARGLLVYMLSLPENSQVSAERLAEQGKEGRGAILTALDELRQRGHYRTRRERVDGGRFTMITEISSEPVAEWSIPETAALSVTTGGGFSDAGNPPPSTEDIHKNNEVLRTSLVEDSGIKPEPPIEEPVRRDVWALCNHLATRVAENDDGNRPNVGERWLTAARLLLDKDKRDLNEAHAVIDWCQQDEFWRGNIESMPKFRKQYRQLRLRYLREQEREYAPLRRLAPYEV